MGQRESKVMTGCNANGELGHNNFASNRSLPLEVVAMSLCNLGCSPIYERDRFALTDCIFSLCFSAVTPYFRCNLGGARTPVLRFMEGLWPMRVPHYSRRLHSLPKEALGCGVHGLSRGLYFMDTLNESRAQITTSRTATSFCSECLR